MKSIKRAKRSESKKIFLIHSHWGYHGSMISYTLYQNIVNIFSFKIKPGFSIWNSRLFNFFFSSFPIQMGLNLRREMLIKLRVTYQETFSLFTNKIAFSIHQRKIFVKHFLINEIAQIHLDTY